jgi:restriction endonuclease S subunit
MATYSIIQKSQLEGALRLDPEYYQPEYLVMQNQLQKYKHTAPLFELTKIQSGPAYSSEEIGEIFEIPLARIGDVTNKTNTEDWLKLSKKEFIKFHSPKINNGDILMTMTGDPPDVGKVNFVKNDKNIELAFNQRVAKLSSQKINNKFLFAYLSTEFSRFQVERAALGIRQRNLGIEDLRNILVIIPTENKAKEIEKLVDGYLNDLENSKSLYSKADDLLLEGLGLKDFKEDEKELFNIVNFSEVRTANRCDAEYFQPKYDKLISKIKKQNAKLLGDLVSMKKGFEPGSEAYQDEGKLFIRVSSLSKNGIIDKDQKYLSNELYQKLKKDFEPKVGEILLTKDATLGVAYVIKEPIEGIIAGGILRLKPKNDIDAEYLTLCISSVIGQMQAERDAGGSVIAHWKPEQIKNLQIPVLPKPTQQKIANLVCQSHEARKKAKELLEEAKKKVEGMIEKQ